MRYKQEKWTGHDVPDFKATMPPDHVPSDDATAEDALRGDEPFVMQADGRGWLFVPSGLAESRSRPTTSRRSLPSTTCSTDSAPTPRDR